MELTSKETVIKLKAGREAGEGFRREPRGEYDAAPGIVAEYIFRAAALLRAGKIEEAFTCARLAHDFQEYQVPTVARSEQV